MAITKIDMPAQECVLTGMDWREVQKQLPSHADEIIMIDMTVERRNKLGNSQDWRYINIPTLDFSTPDWTAQQWLDLASFVYNETDPSSRKRSNVFVACEGGQGRTGIALAILRATLTEDFTNPVKAIRKFNPRFIETQAQEAYVKRIVKELDELTKPAPAPTEPYAWSVRAGKAERRIADLEGEVASLQDDVYALEDSYGILEKSRNAMLAKVTSIADAAGVGYYLNKDGWIDRLLDDLLVAVKSAGHQLAGCRGDALDWNASHTEMNTKIEQLEGKIERLKLDYLKALNCIASVQETVHPWEATTDRDFQGDHDE